MKELGRKQVRVSACKGLGRGEEVMPGERGLRGEKPVRACQAKRMGEGTGM